MAQQWILRKGSKESGFRYVRRGGKAVRGKADLERIDGLRIPPAWGDVHIAVSQRATIQAWGLDARSRKQYRYHIRAVQKGGLRKHYRVRQLAKDLPALANKIYEDLRLGGYPKEKVCAGIVLLIASTFSRVGSDRYERENDTYGLTTLKKSYVKDPDGLMRLEYRGKRSIERRDFITSPLLADFVRSLLKTPPKRGRLFRYERDGQWFNVSARDVNDYLEQVAEFPYTSKDLRTWGGTLRMATILADQGSAPNERARKKIVATAFRLVAGELGNTPAIVRSSYVHPVIVSTYLKNGATIQVRDKRPKPGDRRRARFGRSPEEKALISFLDEYFPDRRSKRRHPDD
jgi:DNA topoisomerase-1